MARIRNIKPDLFRHEALQDLEAAHPGAHIILTYIALWTQADKNGVFPWKPRHLALDILPFLQINIEQNLQILLQAGYLQTFENQQNTYGYIPTFQRHQIIPTKEKLAPSKYPTPPGTHPEQSRHTPGISEEGIRNKENGRGRADNAPAHEEEISNKNAAPAFDQKTNADTPGELVRQLAAFYHAHPAEWQQGVLEDSGGKNYPEIKLREIIQKFAAHRIEKGAGRETYAAQNAALQKWVSDQKNHENRPAPPNGKPYTVGNKTTDYPITNPDTIRDILKKLHPTIQFSPDNIQRLTRAPNEATFHEWAAGIAKKIHNGSDQPRTGETTLTQTLKHPHTQ